MSRVGKKPIPIPKGVTVSLAAGKVSAKGPKGELHYEYASGMKVVQEGDDLIVENHMGPRAGAALWGTTRARIANIIIGVEKGYSKTLEVQGTGWKFGQAGTSVEVHIGYNHPVIVPMPEGVKAEVSDRPPKVTISGIRKEQVGQVAADIRKIRPPEPYLGKGIRYEGEYVRRKAGKSAG